VSSDSDEADWEKARAGEGDAFGRIFDRYRRRLYRHSYRLVPDRVDADDVVAIAFFEAWRRRDSVRFVDGSILPWLLVIATNSAHNVSRSARRYRALLAKLPAAEHSGDHAADSDDMAWQALARLPLADRQVIALCVLDGYSEREASYALGIAPGTVKSRLSRAKSRLASHLESSVGGTSPSSKETSNEA
jgi:RNA polymerase sigma factor (sigma-70 family)